LEEFRDTGAAQPPAAQRVAFAFEQPAPYAVGAEFGPMAQGILQTLRTYRARDTDYDCIGSLFPRLHYVPGNGKPLVRIYARTSALAIPVYQAGKVTAARLARPIPYRVQPRDGEHWLHPCHCHVIH